MRMGHSEPMALTPAEISRIRLNNQHISGTIFTTAKDVVGWMGALQAQDYAMSKWAAGVRLPDSTEKTIEQTINSAERISPLPTEEEPSRWLNRNLFPKPSDRRRIGSRMHLSGTTKIVHRCSCFRRSTNFSSVIKKTRLASCETSSESVFKQWDILAGCCCRRSGHRRMETGVQKEYRRDRNRSLSTPQPTGQKTHRKKSPHIRAIFRQTYGSACIIKP